MFMVYQFIFKCKMVSPSVMVQRQNILTVVRFRVGYVGMVVQGQCVAEVDFEPSSSCRVHVSAR